MRYRIKGYHPVRGIVSIDYEGRTLEQARAHAAEQSLQVIAVEASRLSALSWPSRESTRFDLLLFSQEIRSLTSAGLSLIEALGAISRKETPSRKLDIVNDLIRQVKEGKPFSSALRAYPDEFPPLYLALVAASERTGDVGHALERFVVYRNRLDDVRKRVTAALLYPSLLVGVGGLVILFLMLYVVPRFTRIYEDFGRNLPWMSRLLMQWGAFVGNHGTTVIGLLCLVIAIVVISLRRRNTTLFEWLAESPLVRDRLRQYELSRFFRTTGLLQQGGIPLITSLDMAAELLGTVQRDALTLASTDIRAGMAFSAAMARHDLAPPVALDLLRVGERTGDVGEKMLRIADFYDEEQARYIEWFSKLFEPLLMLGIGFLIAAVIVLLYLPIFELAESLQ